MTKHQRTSIIVKVAKLDSEGFEKNTVYHCKGVTKAGQLPWAIHDKVLEKGHRFSRVLQATGLSKQAARETTTRVRNLLSTPA